MQAQHIIASFEELKAVSDPLRSRILAVLSRGAMTTLQVARELGEKPTRLYHHVNILQGAGLIRVVREQQKRGTVERYLEPIARVFVVGRDLLAPSGAAEEAGAANASQALVDGVLGQTADELRRRTADGVSADERARMKLARLRVCGSEPQIARLISAIESLLDDAARLADGPDDAPGSEYRLQLAFFPLGAREPDAGADECSSPPLEGPRP